MVRLYLQKGMSTRNARDSSPSVSQIAPLLDAPLSESESIDAPDSSIGNAEEPRKNRIKSSPSQVEEKRESLLKRVNNFASALLVGSPNGRHVSFILFCCWQEVMRSDNSYTV